MDERSNLYSLVRRYLANLGYKDPLLATEVPMKETQEIKRGDLVVYDHNRPYIVIEVKPDIPDKKDSDLLKFHPHVRKLQSYATTLGAPYYLLTDGISFLWFMTDASGRPMLLDAPIFSTEITETHTQPSKETVLRSLRSLKQHLYGLGTQETELATLIILAKLLSERGDNQLKQRILDREPISSTPLNLSLFELSISLYTHGDKKYLQVAFDILSNISFSSASPHDLLSSLDEVFFHRHYDLRIARWLSNLLFRLGQVQPQYGYTISDIFCNTGNILAAAGLALKEVSLWGLCPNIPSALWTQLQQVVIDSHKWSVLVEKIPPYHMLHSPLLTEPTHIITVPPFGEKLDMRELNSQLLLSGVNQIEDIYLELAINWVKLQGRVIMLVPEGLLFSTGKRKITRRFIRDNVRITAIISLESGALLPYSGIKTSILVLDKVTDLDDYEVFMAQVKEIAIKDTFDCLEIPQIANILEDFERWTISKQIKSDSLSWVVPINNLDLDNLTVKRYKPSEDSASKQFKSSYQTIPLRQLTKLIKRGVNIKLDTTGSVRVIGPAVIRPMMLDTHSLGQTTEEKLPPQSLTVQIGDILLNNISTYLGVAAVANEEVEGSYISRHVILIRPDTSQVLPGYLAAAINSEYVKPQLQQRATGSIMPTLSLERLADVTIPVPNLHVQQRIIDTIDKARNDLLQAQKQYHNAESRFLRAIQSLLEEG
jgi:N-6 DNA Methylase/Type I restriction enzyme R protein N terminus (HSDR_N)/Type I restriction modification DNA specificity domain